ncbi:PI-3-kinase kinase SMG-1 [Fasciola gigantica]|uniref:PI-3-kinase kinase SMG-1 n=1 Tax=Fasciola gigantica TaxID=46835 RepID=A0A504X9H2_FASGI|nr:PI-3-kinase kinase SMG-1 [Fasciola gigantica]
MYPNFTGFQFLSILYQAQASPVELEKLRSEHAHCKEQFEQQRKRINTLAEQIESQSDEILAIKLEALTASLCEKEAISL